MTELSEKAKEAQARTAQARTETHEQLEAHASDARAAVQRRRAELSGRAGEAKEDMSSNWASLRTHVDEQVDKMHAKIDELRAEHDAKVAERRADRAEIYASEAVDFALDAVAEAEAAVLEAADARVIADAKGATAVAG